MGKMKTRKTSKEVMNCLHDIFKIEVSGITRYLHYSFMVMGHARIPIQKWFRDQATESQDHAIAVGELITSYGGHPPVISSKIEESNRHGINKILDESLKSEEQGLALYTKLVKLAGDDIALEEFARSMVKTETDHIDEVLKMLRKD
jgi:bacterioferritin